MVDLGRLELDVINSAFNQWRQETSNFPHVSDILKICTQIQNHRHDCLQQSESDALQIEHRESGVVSEEDKEQVTEILKGLYAKRDADKAEKRRGCTASSLHWNRQTDEQKKEKLSRLKELAHRRKVCKKHGEQ
jgi:hypothetical protein